MNSNLSELVNVVRDTTAEHSEEILNDKEIQVIQNNLRRMSSEAESELELFWVKEALKSLDTEKILRAFPYYSNYEKMTDLETESMRLCGTHRNHKVLFVGSGPLPLSSIMMAKKCRVLVDNLDVDAAACRFSQKLIERLELSGKIRTIKGDILDMEDLSEYQTILIAALAGENDKEKQRIIDHVVSKSGKDSHIVMRSVSNLGKLLYPEITQDHLKNIQVIRRSENSKDVINSIIIGKKK